MPLTNKQIFRCISQLNFNHMIIIISLNTFWHQQSWEKALAEKNITEGIITNSWQNPPMVNFQFVLLEICKYDIPFNPEDFQRWIFVIEQ